MVVTFQLLQMKHDLARGILLEPVLTTHEWLLEVYKDHLMPDLELA